MKKKPAKKITKIRAQAVSGYQRAYKYVHKLDRKSAWYTAALIFAGVLLLATSVYAGRHASDGYSTNSNALMLTHTFSGNTEYPVKLPGPHATLLIIPLVYVQGHLPYHYTSFTLVNIGLVVATMLGWALLMIKLFGRKYEIPILIILSSLIFTSVAFSYSLAYTTIRNIQYPLVLWFVMIVAAVLSGKRFSRKQLTLGAIGSVLFVVTLAGDSLFNYAIILPLLAALVWYWIQSRKFTINMVRAICLIGSVLVGAALLKFVLSAAHIITFDYTFVTPSTLIPTDKLVPSFSVALKEALDLHGAYIFNQVLDYHSAAIFINFGLLLASLAGFGLIISKANRSYRKQEELTDESSFVVTVMTISFFVVFLIFAASGFAITMLSGGQLVSAENARYISFLPLLATISLVWILKTYYSKHIAFMCALCGVLVLGIFASHPVVRSFYNSGAHKLELSASRDSIDQIITGLHKNNVTEVSVDYWYSDVLRFWSNGTIKTATVVSCDESQLSDTSSPLFTKQNHNTALIIDRGERNYAFWKCSDSQLAQIYGKPDVEYEVAGAGPNEPVKVWIYKNAP